MEGREREGREEDLKKRSEKNETEFLQIGRGTRAEKSRDRGQGRAQN